MGTEKMSLIPALDTEEGQRKVKEAIDAQDDAISALLRVLSEHEHIILTALKDFAERDSENDAQDASDDLVAGIKGWRDANEKLISAIRGK